MVVFTRRGLLSPRSLVLACAAAAALALAACSGGAPSPTGNATTAGDAPASLLDRLELPADMLPTAAIINVQQVRSLLGLPASTPPRSPKTPAQWHYQDVFGMVVPMLELPYDMPAITAIDFSKVTAAARNGPGREQVVVLATTQPFAQLADELSAHGYTRTGDLLSNPKSSSLPLAQIAAIAGAPGIIALGNDPAAVRAAVEGRAHGITGPLRDALDSLNAPAVEGVALGGSSCMSALAVSDDIAGNAGRLLILLTSTPQAARLTAGQRTEANPRPPHLGTPVINGQQLTAPYTYAAPPDGISLFESFYEMPIKQLYRCR
jgi:hypothetical protein